MMRCWVGAGDEGALVEMTAATVPVTDHGFTVGDGVFETMKCVEGRVFLWPWHLERLRHSASVLGIPLPTEELLTDIVHALAAEWAAVDSGPGRVRLTITAGEGPLGSNRLPSEPTVVCAASAVPQRSGGARLLVAPWPRNERSPLAGVKSTSYAENVLALAQANERGGDEAVFLNGRGYLCEGTASNVFVVHGGVVSTPPLSAGLLAGVTRRFVLGLGDADLRITERNVTREELLAADEVFITSSLQDIRAAAALEGRPLEPGPVVRELQQRFAAAALADWCWARA